MDSYFYNQGFRNQDKQCIIYLWQFWLNSLCPFRFPIIVILVYYLPSIMFLGASSVRGGGGLFSRDGVGVSMLVFAGTSERAGVGESWFSRSRSRRSMALHCSKSSSRSSGEISISDNESLKIGCCSRRHGGTRVGRAASAALRRRLKRIRTRILETRAT